MTPCSSCEREIDEEHVRLVVFMILASKVFKVDFRFALVVM